MARVSSSWSAGSSSARAGSRRNIRRSSAADSAGTGTSARNRSGPGSGYRQVTSSAPAWAASASAVITSLVAGSRNSCPPGVRFCSKSSNTTSSRQPASRPATAASLGPSSVPGSVSTCPARASAAASAGSVIRGAAAAMAAAVAVIRAVGFHRPSCTAISQPSSRSREITRPASAVLPIPPIPVSTTPLAAPNSRTAPGSRRSTLIAVRSWARRPISIPTGSSRTDLPPAGTVAHRQRHRRGRRDRSAARRPRRPAGSPPRTPAAAPDPRRRGDRSSSARRRARASACPAVLPGRAASSWYRRRASTVAYPSVTGASIAITRSAPRSASPAAIACEADPPEHDDSTISGTGRPACRSACIRSCGRHRDRVAVLVLQLHRRGRPVRRQVQHMEHVPFQRLADLGQRGHLQDPHLRQRAAGHVR